jgi:hypothetical protein
MSNGSQITVVLELVLVLVLGAGNARQTFG